MKIPRLQSLVPLLVLVLFGAALWVIHHALADYHYQDILRQLRAIPGPRLVAALILTALSYLVMTAYDRLAISYIRHPLERGKVTFASFISYAFSNNIGLSLLTSGSIRYRLYSAWGLSTEEIAKVVAFTMVTFWLGIVGAGGVVFLSEPLALPAGCTFRRSDTRALGLLFAGRGRRLPAARRLRRRPVSAARLGASAAVPAPGPGQLLVGALDWALAGSVLYALLAGVGADLLRPVAGGLHARPVGGPDQPCARAAWGSSSR